MAQLKSTTVNGDLSVKVNDSSELKVSAGSYSGSPELSSVGSSSNSYLQIANLISDSAAGGTNRGIEFVSSFKTNVASTCSLRWDFSSLYPKLYSTSSSCSLGSASNPWSKVYTSVVGDHYSLSGGTPSGGDSERFLELRCDPSVTYDSGTYGTVTSKIKLFARKTTKTSSDSSPTSYPSSLMIYSDGSSSGDTLVLNMPSSGTVSNSVTSTNTLRIQVDADPKSSSTYPYGLSSLEFLLSSYLGPSKYTAGAVMEASSAVSFYFKPKSGNGSSYIGSSDSSWTGVYSNGLFLSSYTNAGSTSGGSTDRTLAVNAASGGTFGANQYGTVNNRISLSTSKVVKSSASGSSTTYNGKLYVYSDGSSDGDKVVLELQDSGKASSSANSTNHLVLKSVGGRKSSTSYNGKSTIQFQCTSYSGSNVFNNSVIVEGAPSVLYMYPDAMTSFLGNSSHKWTYLYAGNTYTSYIASPNAGGSGTSNSINVSGNLLPASNSSSASTGYTLGDSSHKWRYLYAFSGSIQTSDRSAKDSIHYITESNNSSVMKAATMSMRSTEVENTSEGTTSQITLEDVIDFVSNLNPVTFCYKDGQGEEVEATEENSDPEDIQLGLIADDIKDHKLFKYVGVETTYEEEVTPAVKDEEGNVVTEAVTETKTTLGLQAIPLATAALTACKYLIQKNEEIESRLAIIEEQLSELLNADRN